MNEILKYCFLLFLFLFSLNANGQTQTLSKKEAILNPQFKKVVDDALRFDVDTISVGQLNKLNSDYILLDAREPEEFNTSHIKNARLIGYDDPDYSVLKNVEQNTPIIIYCSIGYRSERLGKKLKNMGFKNVRNLYGSIFEWANQGFELCGEKNETTQTIHGYDKSWSQWVKNPKLKVTY